MEFIIHSPKMFLSLLEPISPNKKVTVQLDLKHCFILVCSMNLLQKWCIKWLELHYLKKHVYLTQKKPRWIIWKLKGTQKRSVETIIKSLIENAHTKPI